MKDRPRRAGPGLGAGGRLLACEHRRRLPAPARSFAPRCGADQARCRETGRQRDDMPPKVNGGRRCRRPPLSRCWNLAWEARRPALGGFESAAPRTGGSKRRFLRGPSEAEASSGFPAGSPTGPKPWRFAARRIWNLRPASRLGGSSAEASVPRPAGSSAEASVPPGGPWTEVLGPPVSQLPGRNPVLPGGSKGRSPRFHRWRRADRSPAFRRTGPEPEGPVSRLTVSHVPEGRLETDGRFTKHAAFASAKGQARSFRLAAASSAALPFASPLSAW